jgi:hypothetical protein
MMNRRRGGEVLRVREAATRLKVGKTALYEALRLGAGENAICATHSDPPNMWQPSLILKPASTVRRPLLMARSSRSTAAACFKNPIG